MAIIPPPTNAVASISSHWYAPNGEPQFTVANASKPGELRPTTLRDARKYGYIPSVTTILNVLAKGGLETWKLRRVAEEAFTRPRRDNETMASAVDRALKDSMQVVEHAADEGTKIHKAVEGYFDPTRPDMEIREDALELSLKRLDAWFKSRAIITPHQEVRVVNREHGFAGTMDAGFTTTDNGQYGTLDYKTRTTYPGEPVKVYPNQPLQIAGYGGTFWAQKLNATPEDALSQCHGLSIFISRNEPGRIDVVEYSPAQLVAEYRAFAHLCAVWRYLHRYDPRIAIADASLDPSTTTLLHKGPTKGETIPADAPPSKDSETPESGTDKKGASEKPRAKRPRKKAAKKKAAKSAASDPGETIPSSGGEAASDSSA